MDQLQTLAWLRQGATGDPKFTQALRQVASHTDSLGQSVFHLTEHLFFAVVATALKKGDLHYEEPWPAKIEKSLDKRGLGRGGGGGGGGGGSSSGASSGSQGGSGTDTSKPAKKPKKVTQAETTPRRTPPPDSTSPSPPPSSMVQFDPVSPPQVQLPSQPPTLPGREAQGKTH